MGCDIHSHAERKEQGKWEKIDNIEPFRIRAYSVFGFLADVRNYSAVSPISQPRGIPPDVSRAVAEDYDKWAGDVHTPSWLSVAELVGVDYEIQIEDLRVTRQVGPNHWHGGCTGEPGEGELTTLREFLGSDFFVDLQELQDVGAERIIFWFDN